VLEMVQAANMAFGLCPMLSLGAIEALAHHGSDRQKPSTCPGWCRASGPAP
jgi:alkylation response protein AidB-like acyl-CoA dehydrogenase